MNKYDVIIVGAGPAGIFTAIEMLKLGSKKKILIIEKGKAIENRHCPKNKTKQCVSCKPFSFALQMVRQGQRSQSGLRFGPQRVAPSSIRAWVKSPAFSG